MKSRIPIKNIYYLLSYAWDFVGRGEEDYLSEDSFDNSGELISRIFDISLSILARKGFVKGYEPICESMKSLRGKLNIAESIKNGVFFRGEASCNYDEYTLNCPLNRLLKAAIRLLLGQREISDGSSQNLRRHLVRLCDVADVALTHQLFDSIEFNAHNRHYRFLYELSRLMFENLTVSNSTGKVHFQNFLERDVQMHRIFEAFIRRFFEKRLGGDCAVTGERYKWNIGPSDALFEQRIPDLRTDVTIKSESKIVVIDAKYYAEALTQYFGTFKYRRDHLSQLMEYIRAAQTRHSKAVSGILIYPTTNQKIYDRGIIEGMDVTIATIDLSSEWTTIHESLLEIIARALPERAPAA